MAQNNEGLLPVYEIDGKPFEVSKESKKALAVCPESGIFCKPSSNVSAVMYGNEEDTFVQVQFKNGGNYFYETTSKEVIRSLKSGYIESIGKFYRSVIKPFESRKTERQILVPLVNGKEN